VVAKADRSHYVSVLVEIVGCGTSQTFVWHH